MIASVLSQQIVTSTLAQSGYSDSAYTADNTVITVDTTVITIDNE